MGLLLMILLVCLVVGCFPTYGYNRNWGYGPSGLLGFVLIIVLICILMGYIPHSSF